VPSPAAGNTVAHANRVHPPAPDDDAARRWVVTERRRATPTTSAERLGRHAPRPVRPPRHWWHDAAV